MSWPSCHMPWQVSGFGGFQSLGLGVQVSGPIFGVLRSKVWGLVVEAFLILSLGIPFRKQFGYLWYPHAQPCNNIHVQPWADLHSEF